MVDGSDDESDSASLSSKLGSENNAENSEKCKNSENSVTGCCGKECRVMVCVNCFLIYHKSCSKRIGKLHKIDENRVICCEGKKERLIEEQLKLENDLLRRLVAEMEDKNNILKENNRLLLECLDREKSRQQKIVEKNEESHRTARQNRPPGNGNTEKDRSSKTADGRQRQQSTSAVLQRRGTQLSTLSIPAAHQSTVLPVNPPRNSVNVMSEVIDTEENMTLPITNENKQKQLTTSPLQSSQGYNLPINVTRKISVPEGSGFSPTHEDDFKEVKYRRRRAKYNRRTNYGEGEVENAMAVEKRVWLFISRIKRSITDENIGDYLAGKLGGSRSDYTVKELPTRNSQNKCFMVGANYKHKDEMYTTNFWPTGVGFKRFDFGLYKRINGIQAQNF